MFDWKDKGISNHYAEKESVLSTQGPLQVRCARKLGQLAEVVEKFPADGNFALGKILRQYLVLVIGGLLENFERKLKSKKARCTKKKLTMLPIASIHCQLFIVPRQGGQSMWYCSFSEIRFSIF